MGKILGKITQVGAHPQAEAIKFDQGAIDGLPLALQQIRDELADKADKTEIPTIPSLSKNDTETGNGISSLEVSGHKITIHRTEFLTQHQSLNDYAKKDGSNATGTNWRISITGDAGYAETSGTATYATNYLNAAGHSEGSIFDQFQSVADDINDRAKLSDIGKGVITIKQNNESKGSFKMNQKQDGTIILDGFPEIVDLTA